MKAVVMIEVDVPDTDISEQLDWHVGALVLAKKELNNMKNPCAYDKINITVMHPSELE